MKKADLKKLPELRANKRMIRLAKEDKPRIEKWYGSTIHTYKYRLYMRCLLCDGILKVAIFAADYLRAGANTPLLDLYISKDSREFISYDRVRETWLNAKLDKIAWPFNIYRNEANWASKADAAAIKKYLDSPHSDCYKALLGFQLKVRSEELMARHKLETDHWDEDLFANTPKLPKDWERWVSKVGVPENYIYYEYSKKGVHTGFCIYCEKDVPIKKPRHTKLGRCPCCRRNVMFRSVGKASFYSSDLFCMYLLQRCKEGFIVREFYGYRRVDREDYRHPSIHWWEIRRTIHNKEAHPQRAYCWDMYKNSYTRWVPTGLCSPTWGGNEKGMLYGKTLPTLFKKELHNTGLAEVLDQYGLIDPDKYLAIYNKMPVLEQIVKAKLPRLTHECIFSYGYVGTDLKGKRTGSLTSSLGISRMGLKRLRGNNGGVDYLDWLKYEYNSGVQIPDDVIMWFITNQFNINRFEFIFDKMSALQVMNYVKRQMATSDETPGSVLRTWRDYLSMAEELGIDTSDPIIYRARKLHQRHDELVERIRAKAAEDRIAEIREKFPDVDAIYGSLKGKYEFANEEYTVLVPSGIEDIVAEGDRLHHCVDKNGRYWDRIERRESYVLFLRKTADVGSSYYTLEVEPNGTVRQKRTMYDRQLEDIKQATKFLVQWQKAIAGRVTAEDHNLAEKSRELRVIELKEMREKNVVIDVGDLEGVPLADVLMADLMEAA